MTMQGKRESVWTTAMVLFDSKRWYVIEMMASVLLLGLVGLLWQSYAAANFVGTAFGTGAAGGAEVVQAVCVAMIFFILPNMAVMTARQHYFLALGVWVSVHWAPVNAVLGGASLRDILIYDFHWTGVNLILLLPFYVLTFLRSETYGLLASRWHNF